MAQPSTAKFGKMEIAISDGNSPEVFTAPCGFTSKSLVLSKNLADVSLPDCLDPDAPAWVGRDVQSLTASVTGEGVMAFEALDMWREFQRSVESKRVRIALEGVLATYVWTGLMHLATMTLGAEQGGRVTINVELQSDGEMVQSVETA